MNIEIITALGTTILAFLFWIATLIHIKRSVFMSEREKKRWFRTVLHGLFLGLLIYWILGDRKRISS